MKLHHWTAETAPQPAAAVTAAEPGTGGWKKISKRVHDTGEGHVSPTPSQALPVQLNTMGKGWSHVKAKVSSDAALASMKQASEAYQAAQRMQDEIADVSADVQSMDAEAQAMPDGLEKAEALDVVDMQRSRLAARPEYTEPYPLVATLSRCDP